MRSVAPSFAAAATTFAAIAASSSSVKLFTVGGGWDHDHQIHAFSYGLDGRFYFNMGNAATKPYANGRIELRLSEAPLYVVSDNAAAMRANVNAPAGLEAP